MDKDYLTWDIKINSPDVNECQEITINFNNNTENPLSFLIQTTHKELFIVKSPRFIINANKSHPVTIFFYPDVRLSF
jgi:hypothetical protein